MGKSKNLELQQQGQKPSVIGEFSVAINAAKISQEGDIRLVETLKIIMLKLGIREANLPTNSEKIVLIDHIRKNYSAHTLQELKLAFDLAIAGKLECEVDHYENFSCLYFSKIMTAYRSWSGRVYKELPQEKPKELPASNETVTDEDWIEIARGIWEKTKNPMLLPPELYRILNLNPTEEQKSSVRRRATLMVAKLIQDDPKFFKDDADAGVFQNRLLRQLCVADYFEGKI